VILLVALPRGLGHLMLGDVWRPAYPLILPTTIAIMSTCATTGALVGLHALGAARRSVRVVLVSAAIVLIAALVGAKVGGTVGSMRYYAAAGWLAMVLTWIQFRAALREADTVPVTAWLWPPRASGRHRR